MNIPKLDPSKRHREYDSYSDELRSEVVRGWLFSKKNHRQLDEEVLGLDRNISRGYQSMGILHFLGLKADFHGIFQAISESQVIGLLKADEQDFSSVISFLESGRSAINIKALIETETAEIAKSRTDTSVARNERILNAEKRPKRQRVYSYTYQRNPDIVVEALHRAEGFCENCKNPAPFKRASDGTPFLEVHHIRSLSDGGEDTLENVVALCPNCHREKHYG
ncbi:MAG TPA: HNH endonuclease [Chlorobium sp.]|uniref:HNH endonuclease n=1 Tax=Chlorobium phaeovibrioides (strain DSM 265 / 1930) TaxID=290318 RepID=A4SC99_CHLPM|nr:HNH endonuclease [Chlorobium sp.]